MSSPLSSSSYTVTKEFVPKIMVFRADTGSRATNIIFWVADAPANPPPPPDGDPMDNKLGKRSSSSELRILRQHVFRAKL
jgi:hypothetical protein